MVKNGSLSIRGLQTVGAVLLCWGGANTAVDISRYGLAAGDYWWFCNLALVGVGFGCVIKDRGFVVGFLAICLFTQIFWIADDLSILFLGRSTLGLAIFRHKPDFPLDEFLLSQYHYFTIPIAFLGWGCSELKRGSPLARVALFNPLIFGVSYFAFPESENINCIHRSCAPALSDVGGPWYALGFWLVIFALHLAMAWGLERMKDSVAFRSEAGVRRLNLFVSLLIGFGVLCGLYAMSSRV